MDDLFKFFFDLRYLTEKLNLDCNLIIAFCFYILIEFFQLLKRFIESKSAPFSLYDVDVAFSKRTFSCARFVLK